MQRKMLIGVVMAVVMLVSAMVGNVPVEMVMAQEDESDYMTDVVITTSADAVKIASVHNPIIEKEAEKFTYSYVYFGSYPQSEVTGEALTEEIIQADYASSGMVSEWTNFDEITNYAISGEAVVKGEKYRRMAGEDGSYKYFKYEPIKWRVMSVEGNEALLRSDMALDSRMYDKGSEIWSDNTLRQWLNGYSIDEESFLNSAFTKEELKAILSQAENKQIQLGSTSKTYYRDKVLLWEYDDSFSEASLQTQASEYAWNRGIMRGNRESSYVKWWLMDRGNPYYVFCINGNGELCDHEVLCGCNTVTAGHPEKAYAGQSDLGVCPAVILNLKETNLWKTVEEQENKIIEDGYKITDVSNYKQDYKVDCQVTGSCRLVIALYDENGKMHTFGTTEVQAGQREAFVRTGQVPEQGDYTVKAFLLDRESHAPLCKAYSGYLQDIGIKASGKCGESVYYTLHYDGTLEMYGEGATYDYGSRTSPFYGNTAIRKIVIGEGVQRLGNYLFPMASKIDTIIFPDTLTEIGVGAFESCIAIEKLALPKNLEILSTGIFKNCTGLKEIQWPDNLKTIGDSAFYGCEGLEQLVMPDTVTVVQPRAFYQCEGLKSVHLSDCLEIIGADAFYRCWNLTSIVIPQSVIEIEETAFYGCSHVEDVTLPEGLIDIGGYAFSGTKWFQAKREEGPIVIINNVLLEIRGTERVIPEGVVAVAGSTLAFDGVARIPDSVIWIHEDVFKPILYGDEGDNVQVYVPEGSYAEEFMRTTGRSFYIEKADGSIEAVIVSEAAVEASMIVSDYEYEVLDINDISDKSIVEQKNWESSTAYEDGAVEENTMLEITSAEVQRKQTIYDNIINNEEYLLVIVKDEKEDIFDSDNLLYINQYTAKADGKVSFEYIVDTGTAEHKILLFTDSEVKPVLIYPIESEEPKITNNPIEPSTRPSVTVEPDITTKPSVTPDVPVIEYKMGDVNLDGQITLEDAQLTLKGALKIINLSEEQDLVADMNLDGTVTLEDAKKVLRKALKIDV